MLHDENMIMSSIVILATLTTLAVDPVVSTSATSTTRPVVATTQTNSGANTARIKEVASKWGITLTVDCAGTTARGSPLTLKLALRNGRNGSGANLRMAYFDCEPIFQIDVTDEAGHPFAIRSFDDGTGRPMNAGTIKWLNAGDAILQNVDLRQTFELPQRGIFYVTVESPIDVSPDGDDEQPYVSINRIKIMAE